MSDAADYEGDFRMFSAGAGQTGAGVIILDEFCDRAIPCPEASWPDRRCGNWKLKPLGSDGKSNPLFLLARAFVISLHASEKRRWAAAPANEADAPQQLRDDARADRWATESRLLAVTSCALVLDECAPDLVSSNDSFITWFKSFLGDLRKEGDLEVVDALLGYIRGLEGRLGPMLSGLEASEREKVIYGIDLDPVGTRPEVRYEILALCDVIGQLASAHGKPPTKAEVRQSMKEHPLSSLQEAAVRTNRFGELLASAGFQWLPNGKAGRPPKSKKRR